MFPLFWDVAPRRWVISIRLVEVAWWSHLQRLKCPDPSRWITMLSRNVRHQSTIDAAPHPATTETSTAPLRKTDVCKSCVLLWLSFIDRMQTKIWVSKLIKITYIAGGVSLLSSAVIVALLWCSHVSLPIVCQKRFVDAGWLDAEAEQVGEPYRWKE